MLAASNGLAADLAYDTSADANLRYQLDCRAGVINCNRASYDALWRSLPSRERDADWLARWRGLRLALHTRSFRPEPAGASPVPFDTAIADDRPVVRRDELAEHEVLAVFRPRFKGWWENGAERHVVALRRGFSHSVDRAGLDERLGALLTFFAVDPAALDGTPIVLVGAPFSTMASRPASRPREISWVTKSLRTRWSRSVK